MSPGTPARPAGQRPPDTEERSTRRNTGTDPAPHHPFAHPARAWSSGSRSASAAPSPAGCWRTGRASLPAHTHRRLRSWPEASLFAEVYERIKHEYVDEVDDHALMEKAVRGMVAALDPHSAYLDSEEFERDPPEHHGLLPRRGHRGGRRQWRGAGAEAHRGLAGPRGRHPRGRPDRGDRRGRDRRRPRRGASRACAGPPEAWCT